MVNGVGEGKRHSGKRLAAAGLTGMGLGLFYGFLRPLRSKSTALGDFLFLVAGIFGWIYVSFGICQGDIRLGYTAGIVAGGFLWECTAGRLLQPVFRGIWLGIFGFFSFFLRPIRKIFQKLRNFIKKLFAYTKKSVTMLSGMSRSRKHTKGGRHEKASLYPQTHPDQVPAQQFSDQGGGDLHYRCVYGGAAGDRLAH